jgi:hypothetical protein
MQNMLLSFFKTLSSGDAKFVPFINISHELGLHRSQHRRGVMVALICRSTKFGTIA